MSRSAAEECAEGEWSAAIKVLSAQLDGGAEPKAPLLCNRALCYSKMGLHRKSLKDAEAARAADPRFILAYLRQGEAYKALGKLNEALQTWKDGYEASLQGSADLELALRLRSLSLEASSESSSDLSPQAAAPAGRTANGGSTSACTSGAQRRNAQGGSIPSSSSRVSPAASREASRHAKVNPFEVEVLLNLGIQQVNAGQLDSACKTFKKILTMDGRSVGALIGRGTALALQHKLEDAIQDFSQAITISPGISEAWKRRAQARAALGLTQEAVDDFNRALELDPSCSRDVLMERGTLFVKLKDYRAALQDLRSTISMEPRNKTAYNFMGLALVGSGKCVEGVHAYKQALELDPGMHEAWFNMGQAHKELADAAKATECFLKSIQLDPTQIQPYRLLALLKYGTGDHNKGITKSKKEGLKYGTGDHKGSAQVSEQGLEMFAKCIELHYLHASAKHATGDYLDAVKEFDEVLGLESKPDEQVLQFLSFYQREIALYTASKLNEPFANFKLDTDLPPFFKEAWCKKLPPTLLFPGYTPQPMLPAGSLIRRKKERDTTQPALRQRLLDAADRLGRRTQYSCPGFLPNVRQHRMAGLAILEIMQTASGEWQAQGKPKGPRKGKTRSRDFAASSGSGSDSDGAESSPAAVAAADQAGPSALAKGAAGSALKWRDVFNITVRWRQISEPCDPVAWVDLLTKREFESGFGSHTPILIGQTRVVRYYANFQRAFRIMKQQVLAIGGAFNAGNEKIDLTEPEQRRVVETAKEPKDLHDLVGQDFWVVTPCHSMAHPGSVLDGTRLTLVKSPTGYDFAIRTPGTPLRWQQYDEEMRAAWEELCDAVRSQDASTGAQEKAQQKERIQNAVLRLGFYWYNFMPLARGTAMVGYATMLGLLMACNMEVTATVPKGIQVDWEAILAPRFEDFANAVRPWMLADLRIDSPYRGVSRVTEALPTIASVVQALAASGANAS